MPTELQTMDARRAVWDVAVWCEANGAKVVGLNERLSGNLTFMVLTNCTNYPVEIFVADETARVQMPSTHRNRRIETRNLVRRLPAAIEAGDAPVRERRQRAAAQEAEAAENDRAALEMFGKLYAWCRESTHVSGVYRPADLLTGFPHVELVRLTPRSRRIVLDAMQEAEACDAADSVCIAMRRIGRSMRRPESGETQRVA